MLTSIVAFNIRPYKNNNYPEEGREEQEENVLVLPVLRGYLFSFNGLRGLNR